MTIIKSDIYYRFLSLKQILRLCTTLNIQINSLDYEEITVVTLPVSLCQQTLTRCPTVSKSFTSVVPFLRLSLTSRRRRRRHWRWLRLWPQPSVHLI